MREGALDVQGLVKAFRVSSGVHNGNIHGSRGKAGTVTSCGQKGIGGAWVKSDIAFLQIKY